MKTGLNLAKEYQDQSPEDWEYFAGSLSDLASIPEEDREQYLPKGELQNIGEEKMDCASRAPLNVLETKFNWLLRNKKLSLENEVWLKANGYVEEGVEFSDAFVAINSGTTRDGNSLKAPLDAIRKQGLVPKSMLPQGNTWEEHHDPARITEEIKNMGLEFAKRFILNYQKVMEENFGDLLKEDLLIVAGFAWPAPINGEYPRSNEVPNHAFISYKRPQYFVFDNYFDDGRAGDFIKKLASDYDLINYGYRISVNKDVVVPKQRSKLKGWWSYWWKTILA